MKITERIQAMGNTDYNRLLECLNHPETTAYFSKATMKRIRPIINAVVKFERETGAEVTMEDLDDIRNKAFYRKQTALLMAIMDNIERGTDMTGRTLYEKIDKPWIDCFEDFQNQLRRFSILYAKFNYSDTHGLDTLYAY
jgi:hypothetical protein